MVGQSVVPGHPRGAIDIPSTRSSRAALLGHARPTKRTSALLVSIINPKGGAGRSTVATQMAGEFARRGSRTLLVDLDPQATASTWASLRHDDAHGDLDCVADHRARQVLSAVSVRQHAYDAVVVDTPSHALAPSLAAARVADVVVVPTQGHPLELATTLPFLRLLGEASGGLAPRPTLLLNAVRRTRRAKEIRWQLRAGARVPLLDSQLGLRTTFVESIGAGECATVWDPPSVAARELRALFDEIRDLSVG